MERREQAWSLVVSDHMPPGKAGEQVRGDGAWVFDARRRADAARLPALASDEGKSAFRNWLACGAPLVSQPKVPAWVQQTAAGGSDDDAGTGSDFGAIFGHILQPNCASAGCHNASAAGSLKMLDACGAYAELMRAGACGMPRVRPGDPGSLLLSKIESRTPICGGAMPPTGPLAADKIAVLRDWISSGAPAPSCP
jgi:hypothetical protein